ncbi:MAG TPA: hypothetical protein VFY80_02140 [Burkholderiales bacterium]|nr:hypothetical protein [Burkholderiales bacterium]
MRRRHASGSTRFSEIRGLFNRVMNGQRPSGVADADEALRNDLAGDRRGTAPHKISGRKGGGQ